MNKWFLFIFGVIILVVSILFFINFCDDFQIDDYEYVEVVVEMVEDVIMVNVILFLDLFDEDVMNVNFIILNFIGELSVMVVFYDLVNMYLFVLGLQVEELCILMVDYKIDVFIGFNELVGILVGYWLLWLVLGGGFFVGVRIWKNC